MISPSTSGTGSGSMADTWLYKCGEPSGSVRGENRQSATGKSGRQQYNRSTNRNRANHRRNDYYGERQSAEAFLGRRPRWLAAAPK